MPTAKVSTTEEPREGKLHAGICTGGAGSTGVPTVTVIGEMRMRALLSIVLMLLVSTVSYSESDADDHRNREYEKSVFVGKWKALGENHVTKIMLFDNGKFFSQVFVDDRVEWTVNGSWSIEDNKFIWKYENSFPPLPEEMKGIPDINAIVSVSNNSFVLTEPNGSISKYVKMN